MLDVGGRGGDRTHDDRCERAACRGEEHEARETAQHLERARGDVLVRDGVSGGVREEAERERAAAGAGGGADEGARGDVEGDDHEGRIFPHGQKRSRPLV